MKKNLSLLLAAVMVMNTLSTAAFAAWKNPLKSYNLYEDVTGGGGSGDVDRERAMGEFHENSLGRTIYDANGNPVSRSSRSSGLESSDPYGAMGNLSDYVPEPDFVKGRNETLRESSRNVYADPEETPAWLEGPSFYPNPTLESIIEKYRRSDFAGCLQECTAYVRKYPYDTLGFYYLAMCYTKVSDKDNAVRAYERVIALNDNPMIVKYATNGRNCVLDNEEEECFPNVNEPELLYPYAGIAALDLQPIDPQTLVDRNLARLKDVLSPFEPEEDDKNNNNNNKKDKEKDKIYLPFGRQDDKLDAFINAPYGNGLSPELNKQYKQLQLKKIQETINKGDEKGGQTEIKNFENQKSDSESIKLAYDISATDMESIMKDPEYIRQKQELDELNMLLGNDKASKSDDMMDLLPYMTESHKNLSPEVIQTLMMKSMMSNLTL